MSEWKEFTILELSHVVSVEIDPVLESSLKRIFNWANEMGLKGQAVKQLTFTPTKFDEDLGLVVGGNIKCLVTNTET